MHIFPHFDGSKRSHLTSQSPSAKFDIFGHTSGFGHFFAPRCTLHTLCTYHAAHSAHPGDTPCAHMKNAPCTRVPVRTVVFQPEWSIATVCAFSRAIQIVSGQLGRPPEPRQRSVALVLRTPLVHSARAHCTHHRCHRACTHRW